jgi:hypothetical protein
MDAGLGASVEASLLPSLGGATGKKYLPRTRCAPNHVKAFLPARLNETQGVRDVKPF